MPSIHEFQAALERVMQAEPPTPDPDFELSPDSNQLADVFAGMRYNKESDRSLDALTEKQRAAYVRWMLSPASS